MSLYNLTKGTELEEQVTSYMKGEAHGVMLYYALSRLAKEQGLNDLSETLIEIANDEARHAGLYSVLNAAVPQDIFTVLAQTLKAEQNVAAQIHKMAEKTRSLGLETVADEITAAAKDETNQAAISEKILSDYKQA